MGNQIINYSCPYCEDTLDLHEAEGKHFAECPNCALETDMFDTYNVLIEYLSQYKEGIS